MKKIGILGGTFDPPHFGHLIMANEVASGLNLDAVWFLPNQIPPHKVKTSSTTTEERLQMLEIATESHPLFRIETIEFRRNGPSYTIETMEILSKQYPNHEFYFIIGADMIEYLPKWYKIDELVQLVRFVGVKRPGYTTESKFPIIHVEAPLIDISSKMIRNRIANKETIRYLLPESVRIYIKENHLYGSK
ncbi:nicotinate-nucleotide adenylyltransferase [Neobacillus sp. D3-1R]|uniref:nicotinate-nucleotide adenylyltransferase n=1 Tax=Neobacillus sp. D3-1R TaxID=3445778 RepID=UPI003F9FA541